MTLHLPPRALLPHSWVVLLLLTSACPSVFTGDHKPVAPSPVGPSPDQEASAPESPGGALLQRLEGLAASSATEAQLEDLQLEWSDMQGLMGGTTLQVKGDGATLVVINEGGDATTQPGTISAGQVQALLRDLLDLGVLAATSSVGSGVPDEVRLRVSVAVGEDKIEVWRWQSDLVPGQDDLIGESRALFVKAMATEDPVQPAPTGD